MISRQVSDFFDVVLKQLTQLSQKDSDLRDALQKLADDYLLATGYYPEDEEEPDYDDEHAAGGKSTRPATPAADEPAAGNYEADNYPRPRYERPAYPESRGGYNAPPRGDYSRGNYESGGRGGYDAPPPARGYDTPRSGYDNASRGGAGGGAYYGGGDRGGYEGGNRYGSRTGGYESAPRGGYEDRGRGGWEQRPQRTDEAELTLIEDRCKLKAKGARWAAERRRMINNGADFRVEIDPQDREIITLAKQLPECFLWMNHPSGPSPANLNMFDDLAGCFETLGESVALMRVMLPEAQAFPELFAKAMDLAAEAQSALRSAVYRIDGPNDNDQNAVFHWLKRTASAMQVFIQRYMRADDTANPTKYPELSDRIAQLDKELAHTRKKDRDRAKHLSKVRPLIREVVSVPEEQKRELWIQIADAVDEAVNSGLPVTDSELRSLLSPLARQVPPSNGYPEGFMTVLREYEQSPYSSAGSVE